LVVVLRFILKNFAAPIGFFVVFQFYGAKPAIGVALLLTFFVAAFHRLRNDPMSPFFKMGSALTLFFGSLDFLVATPRFFRLEPAASNFLLGLIFIGSLIFKVSIAEWFAAGLPEKFRPTLDSRSGSYLRKVTLVWAIYFFIKAFIFLYIALRVDLGRLVILRTLIGGMSGAILIGGEVWYRKRVLPTSV